MKIIDNLLCEYGYHKNIEFIKVCGYFHIPEKFKIIARCKNCKKIIQEWSVENIDFTIKLEKGQKQ